MRPVLYSFRRCPYAMRARLTVASTGIEVELREIVLRDKAAAFLEVSPKGTVPVLMADQVIEESIEVMDWASVYLRELDGLLADRDYLFGDRICRHWYCIVCTPVCEYGSGVAAENMGAETDVLAALMREPPC